MYQEESGSPLSRSNPMIHGPAPNHQHFQHYQNYQNPHHNQHQQPEIPFFHPPPIPPPPPPPPQFRSNSISDSASPTPPSMSMPSAASILSREFVARRISEGETGRLKEELKCQACGKGYKHISSLAKHLWEHTPEWNVTSKLLISKHQQVQLLEAASILVGMNEEDETGGDKDEPNTHSEKGTTTTVQSDEKSDAELDGRSHPHNLDKNHQSEDRTHQSDEKHHLQSNDIEDNHSTRNHQASLLASAYTPPVSSSRPISKQQHHHNHHSSHNGSVNNNRRSSISISNSPRRGSVSSPHLRSGSFSSLASRHLMAKSPIITDSLYSQDHHLSGSLSSSVTIRDEYEMLSSPYQQRSRRMSNLRHNVHEDHDILETPPNDSSPEHDSVFGDME